MYKRSPAGVWRVSSASKFVKVVHVFYISVSFLGILLQALSCSRHRSQPDTYRAPAVFLSGHAGNPDLSRPDPVRLCDIGPIIAQESDGHLKGIARYLTMTGRCPSGTPSQIFHLYRPIVVRLSSEYRPRPCRAPKRTWPPTTMTDRFSPALRHRRTPPICRYPPAAGLKCDWGITGVVVSNFSVI